MSALKSFISRLRAGVSAFAGTSQKFDEIKIGQGVILSGLNRQKSSATLSDYEFRIFSQWGEDGILQFLTDAIEVKEKTFIEFGVEDFFESNCRFLMMKDDWRGFVIDGSRDNIERLRASYFYWRHDLSAKEAFVTRENIDALLLESGFSEDLGILSIDIDGVDYFVLEAITAYRPRILVLEYNSVFGAERKVTVPYDPAFYRTRAHYSNLYFGASLAALAHLAERKGYGLVGSNSAGTNAFFVRSDLLNDRVGACAVSQAYRSSNCRESRDEVGKLTFLSGDHRIDLIRGLPVLNVATGQIEPL